MTALKRNRTKPMMIPEANEKERDERDAKIMQLEIQLNHQQIKNGALMQQRNDALDQVAELATQLAVYRS